MIVIIAMMLVICSASGFLILESAEFYAAFGGLNGLIPAALLEIFSLIIVATPIKSYAGRALKSLILTGLFVVIIVASGMGRVNPIVKQVYSDQEIKLISVLNEQIKSEDESIKSFGSKNPMNQALATRRKASATNELKKILQMKKSNVNKVDWINISILLLVRILLQSSNLFAAHSVADMIRKKRLEIACAKVRFTSNAELTGIDASAIRSAKDNVNMIHTSAKCKKVGKTFQVRDGNVILGTGRSSQKAWENAWNKISGSRKLMAI